MYRPISSFYLLYSIDKIQYSAPISYVNNMNFVEDYLCRG